MTILLTWVLNAIALLIITYLIPSIQIAGFGTALIIALVLGFINAIIRPIFILLTLPITLLSLGLFIFVINGLCFWFASSILKGFQVGGFGSALAGSILYSLISWLLLSLFFDRRSP